MEMRVEQLSVRSGLSVDTVRYYQSKGLLDPPRRDGRVAWYEDSHLDRLERIRTLQQRGFTLATIARLLSGDLDAADEALLGELSGVHRSVDSESGDATPHPRPGPDQDRLTVDQLSTATGVPLALLKAVEAEGLLVPRRAGDQEYYDAQDVVAAKAGLCLLEWGIPLSDLLDLAQRHHQATETVAKEAVAMFSTHVRRPLRQRDAGDPAGSEDGDVDRLVRAYAELLPAVSALVGIHFTRTLVNAALDHVDRVGSDAEREAIGSQLGAQGTTVPVDGDPSAPVTLS
jgi:DNA-binding transcriptional MerR regulator